MVNLSPTLRYLASFPRDDNFSLLQTNLKAAFLLGLVGPLRPSDLNRSNLQACCVDSDSHLQPCIVAPKETRKNQCIIKSILIHLNTFDDSLCPVAASSSLRDHPAACNVRPLAALFVDSRYPNRPVKVQTIRARRLSADARPTPSVRSLGSHLTLHSGVPLDNVITRGNWSFSTLFQDHYRRDRSVRTNFMNLSLRSS